MVFFGLSVLFTVAIYLIMRAFPRYGVNAFHAVVFNYYSCVAVGVLLMDNRSQLMTLDADNIGVQLSLLLGALFVVVFLLIALSTEYAGVTAASLAGNMSLVIPVLFGLFVFHNNNKEFTVLNYLGLLLAVVAMGFGALKKEEHKSAMGVGAWIFPILSFFASGTNNTLINYLTMTYFSGNSNTLFMIIACTGAILTGSVILFFNYILKTQKITLRSIVGGLILGVPNFLSLYFLLKALDVFGNSAAFVFPVYNILSMVASAFFAFALFGEKLSRINRLGLILAVLAIVFISYQELGL